MGAALHRRYPAPAARCSAAVRGQLWAREIRFFTCAAAVALLYALGWYTPVFRAPLHAAARRRASTAARRTQRSSSARWRAILAGYGAHRLFRGPPTDRCAQRGDRGGGDAGAGSLPCRRSRLWLGRLPRLPLPLGAALVSFAAAALALAWATPSMRVGRCRRPPLLAAVTTVDLAYNNGPSSSTAQPPALYEVLEPDTPQRHHRYSQIQGRRRRRRAATASSSPASASTGPMQASPTAWRTRWATTPCASPSTAGQRARRTMSACPTSGSSRRCFPSYRSTLANLLGLRFIATGAPIETIEPG